MPTITDMYDSGQDPTTAVLPPMVDPRIFDDPPPCVNQSMAGFRPLDPDQIADAMGVPAAFRVVEPIPDLRTPITCAEWARIARGLRESALNADPRFSVDSVGGKCPTQAEGRYTETNRPYYFRARHGRWTLHIGNPDWPTDYREWPKDFLTPPYETVSGPDWTHGAMSVTAVLAIIAANVPADGGTH